MRDLRSTPLRNRSTRRKAGSSARWVANGAVAYRPHTDIRRYQRGPRNLAPIARKCIDPDRNRRMRQRRLSLDIARHLRSSQFWLARRARVSRGSFFLRHRVGHIAVLAFFGGIALTAITAMPARASA